MCVFFTWLGTSIKWQKKKISYWMFLFLTRSILNCFFFLSLKIVCFVIWAWRNLRQCFTKPVLSSSLFHLLVKFSFNLQTTPGHSPPFPPTLFAAFFCPWSTWTNCKDCVWHGMCLLLIFITSSSNQDNL